jgi:hypothetical protein
MLDDIANDAGAFSVHDEDADTVIFKNIVTDHQTACIHAMHTVTRSLGMIPLKSDVLGIPDYRIARVGPGIIFNVDPFTGPETDGITSNAQRELLGGNEVILDSHILGTGNINSKETIFNPHANDLDTLNGKNSNPRIDLIMGTAGTFYGKVHKLNPIRFDHHDTGLSATINDGTLATINGHMGSSDNDGSLVNPCLQVKSFSWLQLIYPHLKGTHNRLLSPRGQIIGITGTHILSMSCHAGQQEHQTH